MTPESSRKPEQDIGGFFENYYNELCGYLTRALGCPAHEAEDIAMDSFLAVRSQWDNVQYYDKPKAYLYKVAQRRFWQVQRKQVAMNCQGDPDTHIRDSPSSVGLPTAVEEHLVAMELLLKLPRGQAQVMWLRKAAGFSEAETSKILNISVGTVKSQLHDAMAKLGVL